MEGLRSEAKGFIGGGAILATGLGVTAFILAVFALTYLNNKNKDDFTDDRKKQMGNTGWAYFAFLFAIIVFLFLAGWAAGTHWADVREMVAFTGGNLKLNL